MTLSIGDVLAKVRKQEDGSYLLVEGEMQHIFEVMDHVHGVNGNGQTVESCTLLILE